MTARVPRVLPAAMVVACPVCDAYPGERCSVVTSYGRHEAPWVHFAREDLALGITNPDIPDDERPPDARN